MENTKTTEDVFSLGARLGRKQALGLVANRCNTAAIECLIDTREKKLLPAVESTWEAYCHKRIGISRSTAERLIQQYKEQGPNLARLNSYVSIKPSEYRMFTGSVTDEGLVYNGEVIPMEAENASRLSQAVDAIRSQHAPEPVLADPAQQAFTKAKRALGTVLGEFSRLSNMNLDDDSRLRLAIELEAARDFLDSLCKSTGL